MLQYLRGLLMGAADIIPGVSGGTVALILGIYERLVTAISHFDRTLVGHVKGRRFSEAAEWIDLKFLAFLFGGIGTGFVSLARLMHHLLDHERQHTFAVFFGLIIASSVLVGMMVGRWKTRNVVLLIFGALFAFVLVGLPLLETPPQNDLYALLCGMIAICAMILPGISGSFILLLMGKYHDVTGIIKDIPSGTVSGEQWATLGFFGLGAAVGLISFSKFLRWLLKIAHDPTMAVLCGFMIGSLRRIWPFQHDTTPEITRFSLKVFEPFWPDFSSGNVWLSLLLVVLAGSAVFALDWLSRRIQPKDHPTT
jgi:putative membrane protein